MPFVIKKIAGTDMWGRYKKEGKKLVLKSRHSSKEKATLACEAVYANTDEKKNASSGTHKD